MAEKRKPTAAEIEASQWLARAKLGSLSSADEKKLEAWLAASSENRAAYEALNRTYERFGVLEAIPQVLPGRTPTTRRGLVVGAVALAAVLALALVLPPLFRPGEHRTFATSAGEHQSQTLSDGTHVELGAATKLEIAFASNERRVNLSEGEAFFDVAANSERPFIVDTPRGQIVVHGTAFLIEINPTGVRTTVVRGVVEGRADRFPLQRSLSRNGDGVIAHANDEIAFRDGRAELSALAADAVERRMAWRNGMLALDGETLADATAALARETGVRFDFADAALGDVPIGGYVRASDVNAFIALMHTGLGIEAREIAPRHYLLTRNRASAAAPN